MRRAVLALFLLLTLTGTAAGVGEWRITDAFTAPDQISNNSQLMTIAHVEYNASQNEWAGVTPEACSDISVLYDYNTTSRISMQYIDGTDGYFRAGFPVSSADDTVEVVSQGTCNGIDSPNTAIENLVIETGRNLSVTTPNRTAEMTLLEGTGETIWANSTYDGSFTPSVALDWSLRDETGSQIRGGTMTQHGARYTDTLDIPSDSKQFYYLQITGENTTDVDYKNATGGTAIPLTIEQRLDGSLDINTTEQTCSTDMDSCEKGARINATFNVTSSQAEDIRAWVTGNGNNLTTFNLSQGSTWTGNFTVPSDLNTTTYGQTLTVTTAATNQLSRTSDTTSFDIEPFTLSEETASYVFQGNSIDLVFGPFTPFTDFPLDRSLIRSFNISLMYPNGTELMNASVGGDGIDDPNYLPQQRLLLYNASIPADAPTGTYRYTTDVTDIFGTTQSDTFNFNVYETDDEESDISIIDISSSISRLDSLEEIEQDFETTGWHSGSIVLRNDGSSAGTIRVHLSENLSSITSYDISYLSGPPVDLEPDSAAEFSFNFSLQDRGRYKGEITFMIAGSLYDYNRTLPVNFSVGTTDCTYRNGSLCVSSGPVDSNIASLPAAFNISTRNTGTATTISYSPEGNLSDILTGGSQEFDDGEAAEIGVTIPEDTDDGFYSGNISISTEDGDTVRLPVTLQVSVPTGEMSLNLPESDLGSHVVGDTLTFEIQVDNTGDTDLSNITVTNDDLDLSYTFDDNGNALTVAAGEDVTREVTVETEGLDPIDAGTTNPLTLTAESESGVTDTATLELFLVADIEQDIQDLNDSISSLRNQLERIQSTQGEDAGTDIETQIADFESAIENAQDAWANGNYEDAATSFDTATQLQSDVEDALAEAESTDTGNGTDGDGSDGTDDPGETNGGGGLPVLFIVIFLIIIAVVGAILYLSLVPEEDETEEAVGPPRRR